jgi:hypothetical protein
MQEMSMELQLGQRTVRENASGDIAERVKEATDQTGFEATIVSDEQEKQVRDKPYRTVKISIEGMSCAACVQTIENALQKLTGVKVGTQETCASFVDIPYRVMLAERKCKHKHRLGDRGLSTRRSQCARCIGGSQLRWLSAFAYRDSSC